MDGIINNKIWELVEELVDKLNDEYVSLSLDLDCENQCVYLKAYKEVINYLDDGYKPDSLSGLDKKLFYDTYIEIYQLLRLFK